MPTYTITELAREFDITPRAIRFYEDQGLLSPSREGAGGRNRVYTPRDRTSACRSAKSRAWSTCMSRQKTPKPR
jgi:hypothetical protein